MPQLLAIFVLCGFALLNAASAQDSPTDWFDARQKIEAEFVSELNSIAQWCRDNGRSRQADATMQWHLDRDPQRQYIFLPGTRGLTSEDGPPAGTGGPANNLPQEDLDAHLQWLARMNQARKSQGDRVFAFARRAAAEGAGAIAFQSLNETLHYHPDHPQAREILGHRKTDAGWRIASERVKARPATRPHNEMRWPAKEYLEVTTPHFRIASKADEQVTLELAEKLERWYLVWRQVFFEFWSRSDNVERWLNGRGKARKSTRQFEVVFFASRQQYTDELKRWVPGIEASVGYYNDSLKTSFFFASDDPMDRDTWRHEAAHQWFQESVRGIQGPFDDGFMWLGEGIAMYFESLVNHESHFTLGGFDARRLQYARRRKLEEDFYVALAELSALSRLQFQQRPDRAKIYSQSSGVTHMLMTGHAGRHRQRLVEFLKLMYQGKLKDGSFEQILGRTFEQLDSDYDTFLATDAATVTRYLIPSERITELALPKSGLDDAAFAAIGRCHQLQWLDIAANQVTAAQIESLRNCKQLQQLFLTGCRLDARTLAALVDLPALEELDLSYSNVPDEAVAELKKQLPNLIITK